MGLVAVSLSCTAAVVETDFATFSAFRPVVLVSAPAPVWKASIFFLAPPYRLSAIGSFCSRIGVGGELIASSMICFSCSGSSGGLNDGFSMRFCVQLTLVNFVRTSCTENLLGGRGGTPGFPTWTVYLSDKKTNLFKYSIQTSHRIETGRRRRYLLMTIRNNRQRSSHNWRRSGDSYRFWWRIRGKDGWPFEDEINRWSRRRLLFGQFL